MGNQIIQDTSSVLRRNPMEDYEAKTIDDLVGGIT
jgi:hypothetical protein